MTLVQSLHYNSYELPEATVSENKIKINEDKKPRMKNQSGNRLEGYLEQMHMHQNFENLQQAKWLLLGVELVLVLYIQHLQCSSSNTSCTDICHLMKGKTCKIEL